MSLQIAPNKPQNTRTQTNPSVAPEHFVAYTRDGESSPKELILKIARLYPTLWNPVDTLIESQFVRCCIFFPLDRRSPSEMGGALANTWLGRLSVLTFGAVLGHDGDHLARSLQRGGRLLVGGPAQVNAVHLSTQHDERVREVSHGPGEEERERERGRTKTESKREREREREEKGKKKRLDVTSLLMLYHLSLAD